jgi:hypothetical protein
VAQLDADRADPTLPLASALRVFALEEATQAPAAGPAMAEHPTG